MLFLSSATDFAFRWALLPSLLQKVISHPNHLFQICQIGTVSLGTIGLIAFQLTIGPFNEIHGIGTVQFSRQTIDGMQLTGRIRLSAKQYGHRMAELVLPLLLDSLHKL